jgi:hypothetical protein
MDEVPGSSADGSLNRELPPQHPERVVAGAHGSGVVVRIAHHDPFDLRRSRSGGSGDTGCVGGVSDMPYSATEHC